jgi:membrane protease YdiL (CAAX protease family)
MDALPARSPSRFLRVVLLMLCALMATTAPALAGDEVLDLERILMPATIYFGLVLAAVIVSWIFLAMLWSKERRIFPPARLAAAAWTGWDVLLLMLAFFLTMGIVGAVLGPKPLHRYLAVHGLVSLLVLIAMQFVIRARGQQPAEGLGLKLRGLRKHLEPAVLVFFACIPIMVVAAVAWTVVLRWYVGGDFDSSQRVVRELFQTPSPQLLFQIAVAAILVAPVFEETLFRGFLYRALRRYVPARTAIFSVGVLFGVFHLPAVATVVPMTVLGMVLCYVYEKTGRLTVPILLHFLFNLCQVGFIIVIRNV